PQGARKKVYIIDEVHMLSAQAFNALLKTLEEPPPHVMFIFATTEPHKVLPTILSRCQRFDFRRIAVPEIVERLREICAQEDVTADDGSLILIARKGDGALRDALSVFDQAVALCGTDLKYSELTKALGVVVVDLYFDVSRRVIDQDLAGMLRLVQKTVHAGHDLQEFLAGLAEHFRNLLVARTMEDASLVEATEETRRRYAEEAQHFTESDLLRLLTLAEDASEGLKESSQPRLKLETALLKMASIARAADLRQALEKLQRLEELAAAGKFPKDRSGGGSSGTPNDPEGRTTSPSSDAALSGKPDALPKRSATATDPSSGARMSSSPATVGSSSPAPKRDTQSKGAASKAQIGQS